MNPTRLHSPLLDEIIQIIEALNPSERVALGYRFASKWIEGQLAGLSKNPGKPNGVYTVLNFFTMVTIKQDYLEALATYERRLSRTGRPAVNTKRNMLIIRLKEVGDENGTKLSYRLIGQKLGMTKEAVEQEYKSDLLPENWSGGNERFGLA